VVAAEIVVLAVDAQAELTFERRPLPAHGGMRRVGEGPWFHDVLQVVGHGPAESGGDLRVESRGSQIVVVCGRRRQLGAEGVRGSGARLVDPEIAGLEPIVFERGVE